MLNDTLLPIGITTGPLNTISDLARKVFFTRSTGHQSSVCAVTVIMPNSFNVVWQNTDWHSR